jgi:hypothetical protein
MFFVGSVLRMGVWASETFSPSPSPMAAFEQGYWWIVLVLLVGGLFSTVTLAVLYSYAERSIPIRSAWKKGFLFGGLSWLVSRMPATYYAWLMYSYPGVITIVETINGIAGSVVTGVVLAIVFERIK